MKKISQLALSVLLLVGARSPAFTAQNLAEAKVIIGLSGTSADFQNQACETIHQSLYEWNLGTQIEAQCLDLSQNSAEQIKIYKAKNQFDLFISLNESTSGQHQLNIENWHNDDSAEPNKVSWTILSKKNKVDWRQETKILLQKFSDYQAKKQSFKEFLLVNAISDSKKVGLTEAGQYVDLARGQALGFDSAYQQFRDENKEQKYYLTAALEIAVTVGASIVNYYASPGGNVRDWDFDARTSFKKRLNGKAVRFDDNHFHTNTGHYFAGLAYYTIARSNGLDRMESLLVTLASSTAWEYLAEYHEVVSINDQINTTLGGFILGESIHNIKVGFKKHPNSYLGKMLQATFGSPERLNHWVNNDSKSQKLALQNSGYHPDVWSQIDVYGGQESRSISNPNGGKSVDAKGVIVGMDAQVMTIPMFEEPGHVQKILTDDVFSELLIEHSVANNVVNHFKLFAKTTLGAYYEKNLGRDAKGNLNGYDLIVGPSSALDLDTEIGGPRDDFRGVVHVIGTTLDLTAFTNGIRIRCTIDVYGDFAMIRSYAFDDYSKTHDVSNNLSVLRNEQYYYGRGTTADIHLSASAGKFQVGVAAESIQSSAINSRSRFSEKSNGSNGQCGAYCNQVDSNFINLTDKRKSAKIWLAYQITPNLEFRQTFEKIQRTGGIESWRSVSGSEIRKMSTLVYKID